MSLYISYFGAATLMWPCALRTGGRGSVSLLDVWVRLERLFWWISGWPSIAPTNLTSLPSRGRSAMWLFAIWLWSALPHVRAFGEAGSDDSASCDSDNCFSRAFGLLLSTLTDFQFSAAGTYSDILLLFAGWTEGGANYDCYSSGVSAIRSYASIFR